MADADVTFPAPRWGGLDWRCWVWFLRQLHHVSSLNISLLCPRLALHWYTLLYQTALCSFYCESWALRHCWIVGKQSLHPAEFSCPQNKKKTKKQGGKPEQNCINISSGVKAIMKLKIFSARKSSQSPSDSLGCWKLLLCSWKYNFKGRWMKRGLKASTTRQEASIQPQPLLVSETCISFLWRTHWKKEEILTAHKIIFRQI